MIIANSNIRNMLNSPVRKIQAKVELYNGSTLVNTYSYTDRLINFSVERVGDESKFFGYTICQKINIHLIDKARELNITTANSFKVYFGVNDEYICPFPTFYVTQCRRDENTNELSITAYDKLYAASKHTVAELGLTSYTIEQFAAAGANLIGATNLKFFNVLESSSPFDLSYPEGANYEGTELLRDAFDDVAEATQTICYVDNEDYLVFRRLLKDADADLVIDKSKYITLDSGDNRRIQTVMHVTELGDNVSASTIHVGSTAYVRDNPFWDLRDDIGTLVDNALAIVGDLSINQFECAWRGNFLLEPGDKIGLITKDNKTVYSYILDETIDYNGSLSANTRWEYSNSDTEEVDNPSNLGEALKKTYATVDKVNKEIDIVASLSKENEEAISSIKLTTESITNTVQSVESVINGLTQEVEELTKRVEAIITPEDLQLQIKEVLQNGITEVTTTTGFTFNKDGLSVSKTGSEMNTSITEDGMTVYRDKTAMLVANNEGVEAVNLKASTYLIIGLNSRFEDYDNKRRTGCFWIGG